MSAPAPGEGDAPAFASVRVSARPLQPQRSLQARWEVPSHRTQLGAWVSNGVWAVRPVADDLCVHDAGVVMSAMVVQGRLVEVPAGEGGEPAVRQPVGEEKTFRPYDPEQVLLLAPVLSEWVPEGDLAHFVSDLVESGALDLSAIRLSVSVRPETFQP